MQQAPPRVTILELFSSLLRTPVMLVLYVVLGAVAIATGYFYLSIFLYNPVNVLVGRILGYTRYFAPQCEDTTRFMCFINFQSLLINIFCLIVIGGVILFLALVVIFFAGALLVGLAKIGYYSFEECRSEIQKYRE